MTENNEPIFADTSEATDRRAFAPAEMVHCPACLRSNAPTRGNCLYCGAALAVTEKNVPAASVPSLPESPAEKSFHVVAVPGLPFDINGTALSDAAKLVELTLSEFMPLVTATIAAPLCSTTTLAEAETVRDRLRDLGIETVSIEEQLHSDTAVHDLRGLELRDESLTAVYRRGSEQVSVSWEDIELIVLGRLHVTTVEVEQKRKRKRSQVLEERELSTDEAVLDLYVRDDPAGWRIKSGSFDFSCLGKDKAMTAFENFAKLSSVLQERALNARFDDYYKRLRSALNKVWPIEQGGDTTERRRSAKGRIEAKITSSDNEAQFTRYSRLLRLVGTLEVDHNK